MKNWNKLTRTHIHMHLKSMVAWHIHKYYKIKTLKYVVATHIYMHFKSIASWPIHKYYAISKYVDTHTYSHALQKHRIMIYIWIPVHADVRIQWCVYLAWMYAAKWKHNTAWLMIQKSNHKLPTDEWLIHVYRITCKNMRAMIQINKYIYKNMASCKKTCAVLLR